MASPQIAPLHSNRAFDSDPGSQSLSAHRSQSVRRESDNFLSYYGSEDAGRTYTRPSAVQEQPKLHEKGVSADSNASSNSTTENDTSDSTSSKNEVSEGTRRPGTLSEGGTDRRRLAIVQMDCAVGDISQSGSAVNFYTGDFSSSSVRSRRGLGGRLGDLALVAPPDASPKSYAYMTPPSTAPATADRMVPGFPVQPSSAHHRSQSDAVGYTRHQHPSSRDVGIVGMGANDQSEAKQTSPYINNPPLTAPIFQQARLRSSSVGATEDLQHAITSSQNDTSPTTISGKKSVLAPIIGQGIDASVSSSPPVVLNLAKIQPLVTRKSSTRAASSESRGQPPPPHIPAITSEVSQPSTNAPGDPTAGLATPTRATLNNAPSSPPPRPPRLSSPPLARRRGDVDSVTQPFQLTVSDSSSTSSLGEAISNPPQEHPSGKFQTDTPKLETMHSAERPPKMAIHRREGAFPPSVLIPADTSTTSLGTSASPGGSDLVDFKADSNISPPSLTAEPKLVTKESPNVISKQGQKPDQNVTHPITVPVPADTPDPSQGRQSSDISSTSSSERSKRHTSNTPSPPPKSPKGFKARLGSFRRFSALPRTPSVGSRGSSTGPRTPSPSTVFSPPAAVPKIKVPWPSAMQCADVVSRKTALDRCAGYAQKINELYIYDCGLSDWLADAKHRHLSKQRPSTQKVSGLGLPAGGQPRQTSRSSGISAVTFPMRLDASVATDLSVKSTEDINVPTAPPPLPYPSLAKTQQRPTWSSSPNSPTPSTRLLASPITTGKAGGFFSSLGRMASVKKDKSGLSISASQSSSSGKQQLPANAPDPTPRPVNIETTPSVPGGPRAPPHRPKRSQTIMVSPFKSQFDRSASLARRPSLNELPSESAVNIQADPEFIRQVDKLADLLPRADRSVLAGYLRRSGQDILAIGQYLEDEMNGTIRRD